jgi:acetyl-CoA C-acetyltransferase
MRRAVIVSTARTPIGRAYRGAFNDTQAQTLAGHAIAEAVKRAKIDPGEIDDVIMGAALQQGSQGSNVARQAALRAGLPDAVAAMSLDRQCSSGMMAIATAAKEIMHDGMQVAVGGGVESISLVQNEHMNRYRAQDDELVQMAPAIYMTSAARRRTSTRCARNSAPRLRSRRAASTTRSSRCRQRCWLPIARPARCCPRP